MEQKYQTYNVIVHFADGTSLKTYFNGYSKRDVRNYVFNERRFPYQKSDGKIGYRTPKTIDFLEVIDY